MGKRKRSSSALADPPSDSVPCSSGRDLTPGEQNSSEPDDSNIFTPISSVKGIMDSHGKQPNHQLSLGQHHYNMNRPMFLKRSRHHYGNQYSRRNSPNYHRPSTSGKSSPLHDERLCFKLGSRYNSELRHHPDFTEFREKPFWRPERIRTSSSVIDAVVPEAVKMVCGICQKSLKRRSHHFGSTLSQPQEELSIVAVLVCGHIFHADCLEQRTSLEDIRDPPCPMCTGLIPKPETA